MFWIGLGAVEGGIVLVEVEFGVLEDSDGVPSFDGLDFEFFWIVRSCAGRKGTGRLDIRNPISRESHSWRS